MTDTLLLCAILTTVLGVYSLGHYFCAAIFLFGRPRARAFEEGPDDAVAVLIPAKNEGERSLRAITSLLAQDHRGPLEIVLLLKDATDSSIPFLRALHPDARLDVPASSVVELSASGNRRVVVAYTGSDPKSDKINWMTSRVAARFTAILDADHQAEPG